jgi:hypothetical protein
MQERNQQDQRAGGYGDSTGGQRPEQPPKVEEASAGGREGPPTDTMDADEALGNRTGGYGGNPSAEEAERDA